MKKKYAILLFSLMVLILFIFSGCATTMSLEEAKKVTVSMSETRAIVTPPRRIDDILSVLNQPGQFESQITRKFEALANANPPNTEDTKTLKIFYRERGDAAFQLGRYLQAREDLQKALSYGIEDDSDGYIKGKIGFIEGNYGNFQKAIELTKESLKYRTFYSPLGSGYSPGAANRNLVGLYIRIGDLDAAKSAKQSGDFLCRNYSRFDQRGQFWCDHYLKINDAVMLEAQGNYAAAEVQRRNIKDSILGPGASELKIYPQYSIKLDLWLANNLLNQQRLIEAEVEVRKCLLASLAHTGKESLLTGEILISFTRILQAQGRLEEAKRLSDAAIHILETVGAPMDSFTMGLARVTKGNILAVMEDRVGAMSQYDLARTGMKENQHLYERSFTQNSMMILSMLMTGRYDEALRLASQNYDKYRQRFGEGHENTAEMLALRGIAQEHLNHLREAVQDLSTATDILMQSRTERGEFATRKKLRRTIINDYIGLLAKIKGTSIEKELGIDTVGTAFKLAEANRSKNVQGALVASSARAAVTDPELADLIRKEQDADRQILTMESSILDLMAAPAGQQDPKAVQNLQLNIENLRRARESILAETKKRFPRYADFVNPSSRSIASIQGSLRPGEVLLSFYTTKDQTFVWAIPPKGDVRFTAAAIGRDVLIPAVAKLRKSLDPNPETLGDIPDFDVSLAYDLYTKLFSPVEPALKNATDLFIIANGPLDQIPFAVLPTAPFQLARERGELFAGYRQVPWLIRKFSIAMEPSVAAFVTLRALPPGDHGRKAFLGFGDPLFNREQLALLKTEQSVDKERKIQERGHAKAGRVQVRGTRSTEKGNLDNQKITSIQTENLNRLPDTAEEIKTVAQVLNADLTKDVFLQEQASKHRVKTMTLSDRKVIAFATHALVPGDLDGLDQPALALSSPSVTGDQEDGLLTMTEIMKLKINADWVVLSACNTGAASGAGAEALSGLGQAFFYAGSRAILASMYPVETTSARKLITKLFELQVRDSRLTRSQALRESILDLIDNQNMLEQPSDKRAASYAHPLFWAPFIIVGDPGGN